MTFRNIISVLKNQPLLLILQAVLNHIPSTPIKLIAYHSFLLSILHTTKKCKNITIKVAIDKDIDLINTSDDKKHLFLNRLRSGEICLIAYINGVYAGYEWFTITGIHKEERYDIELDIPGNSLYAYDAFVNPEYQRQGVWQCIIQNSYKLMKDYKKTTIFSYIDYGNLKSEFAHQKVGFKRRHLYISITILKFNHVFKLSREHN